MIALATCAALPEGDADDVPLVDALRDCGVQAEWVTWNDHAIDWSDFDLVLIRSTWDYTLQREEFLRWAQQVPNLVNSSAIVDWNSDKRYLLDLAHRGVPIVPTQVAPADQTPDLPEHGQFVVKPSVGAGARGAARFDCGGRDGDAQRAAALAHIAALQDSGRTALIQPYVEAVDSRGETGLVFFEDQYSHGIRKAPMLPPGAAHTLMARDAGGVVDQPGITPRRAVAVELAAAHHAMDAARDLVGLPDGHLPYARVDLLPGPQGPLLVELELLEPSLYLRYAPEDAVLRFAQSLASRAAAARS